MVAKLQIMKPEPVHLREIWAHEAHDFTHWLSENLDYLSELLGFEIVLTQREKPVGPFSVDILAETNNSSTLIAIENQIEKTDHDHLGKLITYMSNLDAKIAIWVTSEPQPEHEKAVHWLNEMLPLDSGIYLIKLEAYKVGIGTAMPLFSIVAGPTLQGSLIGKEKKELGARHQLRLEFWQFLLDKINKTKATSMFNGRTPTLDNWMNSSAGKGFYYDMIVRYTDAQVDIYLDTGDFEKNKQFFDHLYSQKDEIEQKLGYDLEWIKNEVKRACRIRYILPAYGVENKDHWDELTNWLITNVIKFKEVFQPYIDRL